MNKILSFSSSNFTINGGSRGSDIEVYDFTVADAVEHFGLAEILEEIGKDAVKDFFGLTETSNAS